MLCVICQLRCPCYTVVTTSALVVVGLTNPACLYVAEQTESGQVAVSAGQFKAGPYRSTDSVSLSYTDGSSCGSSSYSTTIVFRCRPGVLQDLRTV